MNIWETCQDKIAPMESIAWRVVETQNQSYTRKLVDSDEELDILENLLEKTKTQLDEAIFADYHYLLFTPFRYPPLKYGSRFGCRFEPSLWYGSEQMATAFREVAYYRLLFLQDTEANLELQLIHSAFSVKASSNCGIQLTAQPVHKYHSSISSPSTYEHSQPLGTAMRENGVELFTYYSARSQELEKNIGIFYPKAFISKKLHDEPLTWSCYANKETVDFWHTNKNGIMEKIICTKHDFQHKGVLRYPYSLDPRN